MSDYGALPPMGSTDLFADFDTKPTNSDVTFNSLPLINFYSHFPVLQYNHQNQQPIQTLPLIRCHH